MRLISIPGVFLLIWVIGCSSKQERLIDCAGPVKLVEGFGFAEGPVADTEGNLYFTDIPGSKIYKWSAKSNLELIADSTGNGNGLSMDQQGNLIVCEMGRRRISMVTREGGYINITDSYQGKMYNRPNDVWVHPGGGIYFTDPAYFLSPEEKEQDIEAVYYIDPSRTTVRRVSDHLTRPNGIVGTRDGSALYVVSDTIHKTWKFRISKDGTLAQKQLFIENGHDGLTLDEKGNLYIANRDSLSVDIYNSKGHYLERIYFPEPPSNVCFGGAQKNILYATAETSVYAVKMRVSGQ